jgi:site-specific recombinase XerC
MGATEVVAFLTHLAVKANVAASAQNPALSALLLLYREVLHQELAPADALRVKQSKRLPTALTKEEALRLIDCLSGTDQLMTKLIYGSGLRLMEVLRLRVEDLEFERRPVIVRDGNGAQDRVTVCATASPPTSWKCNTMTDATHPHAPSKGFWITKTSGQQPTYSLTYTHARTERSERIPNQGGLAVRSHVD